MMQIPPPSRFFCAGLKQPFSPRLTKFLCTRICPTIGWIALLLLLFWIYGDRPLVAEPWQWADDGLYLRQSESFVRWLHGAGGPWLGLYDGVLLSKAPLFAIWMGFLNILHIPLRLGEFSLLLVLPLLFRSAVRPVLNLSGWRWALVAVILIAMPFLPQEQKMLRSALQAGFGSACLISAVGLILRVRDSGAKQARWAIFTGLFYALCYLTREEAIWLLPAVVCTLIASFAGAWWQRKWQPAAASAACLLCAFALPVTVVSALNFQGYGIMLTTTRRAPMFTRAYQRITSLEPQTREPYVPIRTATRLKAYMLSPTFARLQSYLEGPAGDSFAKNPGHLRLNGRSPGTREFFVSDFEFALRDAAFEAGARTAPAAEKMFAKIERELRLAIREGKITAGNHGPSLTAAPLPDDYRRILEQALVSLRDLYMIENVVFPVSGVSSGEPQDLQRMSILTNTSLAPPKENQSTKVSEIAGAARHTIFFLITYLEAVAYAVGTLIVLIFTIVTISRHLHNPSRLQFAFCGLVLCGSLVAFNLSIAVVHVLGFPLIGSSYNMLGYSPLSVLGAFGLVMLVAWQRMNSTQDVTYEPVEPMTD
jgi:hypothetical protein